tara:strand:- start:313 stop:447 length:135 start_codon:yes stop_codon:yes gene_type:complete
MILNKFSTIKKIVKEFKKPHSRFRNSDETTVFFFNFLYTFLISK